jgi:hypothetical protein
MLLCGPCVGCRLIWSDDGTGGFLRAILLAAPHHIASLQHHAKPACSCVISEQRYLEHPNSRMAQRTRSYEIHASRQWRLLQLADWLSERDRVWPSPSAPLPLPLTALEQRKRPWIVLAVSHLSAKCDTMCFSTMSAGGAG